MRIVELPGVAAPSQASRALVDALRRETLWEGARVLELLETLLHSRGLAMLMITHDLAVARRLCRRIAVMDEGRIVEQGPHDELMERRGTYRCLVEHQLIADRAAS